MWSFKICLDLNLLLQNWHLNCFSPAWVLKCFSKPGFCLYLYLQMWHWYTLLSPLCVHRLVFKVDCWANFGTHNNRGQGDGFRPEWTPLLAWLSSYLYLMLLVWQHWIWIFSSESSMKVVLHLGQVNSLFVTEIWVLPTSCVLWERIHWPEWISKCFVYPNFVDNFLLQMWHS